jgi:hypothetical protein
MSWVCFLWESIYEKIAYILGAAAGSLLAAPSAYAGVTAVSFGRANPADFPDIAQPSPIATTATTGGPGISRRT